MVMHMVMQLHGAGHGAKSIARYLSSWRSWFTWLVHNGHAPSNPVKTIRAPKAAKGLPKALSVDDAAVVAVVDKLVKQRKDSIAAYEQAARQDLAEKEKAEKEMEDAIIEKIEEIANT